MDQIKVGDVVVLKSGGPKMTVSTIDRRASGGELHAWCDWFVQDKAPWKKESGVFALTSLKLTD
ncbi:uncharacterized protein DUF2158 [Rhizobium sp. PP-WC-2G-219]|uniref:DUF2158 domain-containing protein n=1 Tax=Ferranicluibacter rubi TaxID=2715133 RepID=A0AA44CBU8_9HYPH|nr:DUF2158 domain-containing protein [Ferranicluibacter rubi]NHT77540.1 DUF2158 domain-containing protein [Ferranicluibacter rubi]TCL89846.1 uncharacterized protein DUF2158 [Rhizobium sp. PP-WC-2G-219]